ncbi:oxidative damage protection protein [Psychrobacter sp. AOP22-C1-22]|uniref:oxidative damage protection protein n=1 Tax=unclassified Psychrobacter TaxID=196806 RepID=UPI001788207B|nr:MULTISPECIES: oxidative damage protection protein [unclassified Psychrobacter]MBE0407225.1 oxidative damage protection protein [Psychrobacter sp. FME6]MBE0446155.1 oxidative damage protection protein [Psychrobacter sp. FME5]MDN5891554.1 oxidative damage protection protein [Psychrobacter sp.]
MTETFNPQANTVFCRKYKQELPKMPHPPFPNKKGQELQETVSDKAWKEWLEQQTMLINENHLSMLDPEAKKFLTEQRDKFLDNEDYERAQGWTPENK